MEAIITEKQRRRQVKNTKEVAGDKERKDVTALRIKVANISVYQQFCFTCFNHSSTSMLVKSVKLKTVRFKRKKLHS